MSFYETPRFPERLSLGAKWRPVFATSVVAVYSGREKRKIRRPDPLREYTVELKEKLTDDKEAFLAFMYSIGVGMAHGFRLKDWADYICLSTAGRLGTGAIGTGYPTYQLYKRYTSGAQTYDRVIKKPVSGTTTIYKGGVAQTAGASPGNYSLDTTTGIVTFVASSTKNITGITQANPGVVTATAHGFTNGQVVYISGVSGMTQVNNLTFTVANVTANTFELSGVNTTGYTAYVSGGTADLYPQASDALTWGGQFDVPVRFNVDDVQGAIYNPESYSWDSIPLIELVI